MNVISLCVHHVCCRLMKVVLTCHVPAHLVSSFILSAYVSLLLLFSIVKWQQALEHTLSYNQKGFYLFTHLSVDFWMQICGNYLHRQAFHHM